jgi:hypothetical protein
MQAYPTPPAKSRRGLIASVAAIVVVVAGAAVTYTALNDAGSDNGASSPQGAVSNAIADLHTGDVIGLLDDMPSGERAALVGPLQDDVTSLKRLGVLSPKADPHKVTGVTFTASNIQFAPTTIVVNDHVQIVRVTGGTITANTDAMKLPLTAHMLDLTHASAATATSQTTNLADVSGGVRIATVEQAGRWYVSVFYTAADAAAKHQIPSSSDYIPAHGAATAVAAVHDEVTDLLGGKLSDALGLISPDELGAVHDYGGLLLSAGQGFPDTGIKINTLDLNQTGLSDGAVRVTLAKIALTLPSGEAISVTEDGACFTTTIAGTTKKECAADTIKGLESALSNFRCGGLFGAVSGSGFSSQSGSSTGPGLPTDGSTSPADPCGNPTPLTSAQKAALTHLVTGETGLGFIVSQTDGQWYLDPVRTITELASATIGSLQGDDLFALVSIFTG